MGLAVMIVGLALFLGVHTLPAQRELRGRIVSAMGEGGYKLVYALVSLLGDRADRLGLWRITARPGMIDVWEGSVSPRTLVILKHITLALMLPAVILVVASYLRGHIYTTLKHPMLAGVKLWAAAHLLANGDLGSIILFGSFLGWAVFDRISLKRRARMPAARRFRSAAGAMTRSRLRSELSSISHSPSRSIRS